MPTFVLSDNTVNSHGFSIDMEKLSLDRFKANPVMLYNHRELIGKWENIRVEDGKLMADPVFMEGENEDLSVKVKARVDNGFLKGASLGIHILKWTEQEGQAPLAEVDVMECSVVDIPSNANAITLYNENGEKLTGKSFELALQKFTKKATKNNHKMKLNADTYQALGLNANATEADINTAIQKLNADKLAAENQVQGYKDKEVEVLLNSAIKEGRITADKKAKFEQLAKTDFVLAKETLESMPKRKELAGKEQRKGGSASNREDWTFKDWREKDTAGLLKLKTENPERYIEIVNS